MACLEMYNSDQHKGHNCPPISPRISFSNDFVDSQQMLKHQDQIRKNSSNSSSSFSSDFEFSVSNYSMMSADELFSKGRLLPFKNTSSSSSSNQTQSRTIRDELLAGDDDNNNHGQPVSLRPPKGASSTRWKGLLGLKRSNHIGSKKIDNNKILENNNNNTSSSETTRRPGFAYELPKNSQEYLSNDQGGSSHRDVEIGI